MKSTKKRHSQCHHGPPPPLFMKKSLLQNRSRDWYTGPQAGSLGKGAGLSRRQGMNRPRPSVVPGEKSFGYFSSRKVPCNSGHNMIKYLYAPSCAVEHTRSDSALLRGSAYGCGPCTTGPLRTRSGGEPSSLKRRARCVSVSLHPYAELRKAGDLPPQRCPLFLCVIPGRCGNVSSALPQMAAPAV